MPECLVLHRPRWTCRHDTPGGTRGHTCAGPTQPLGGPLPRKSRPVRDGQTSQNCAGDCNVTSLACVRVANTRLARGELQTADVRSGGRAGGALPLCTVGRARRAAVVRGAEIPSARHALRVWPRSFAGRRVYASDPRVVRCMLSLIGVARRVVVRPCSVSAACCGWCGCAKNPTACQA